MPRRAATAGASPGCGWPQHMLVHTGPGPLGDRPPGDQKAAVGVEDVDRERQVQRRVRAVHLTLRHRSGRATRSSTSTTCSTSSAGTHPSCTRRRRNNHPTAGDLSRACRGRVYDQPVTRRRADASRRRAARREPWRPASRVPVTPARCSLSPPSRRCWRLRPDASATTTILVAVAFLSGRLLGEMVNDWIDAARDSAVGRQDKPVVSGSVTARTVRWAALTAAAATVPLSLLLGLAAGLAHLVAVAAAWAYNAGLKSTAWSWAPYALAFGLLPAVVVLALPGHPWPPAWAVAAGALLGVGAHLLNVLPDLDDDRSTGVRGFPHRLGRTWFRGSSHRWSWWRPSRRSSSPVRLVASGSRAARSSASPQLRRESAPLPPSPAVDGWPSRQPRSWPSRTSRCWWSPGTPWRDEPSAADTRGRNQPTEGPTDATTDATTDANGHRHHARHGHCSN